MVPLRLRLNGNIVNVQVEAWDTLLDVLRDRLGMIGTKCGCRHGDCGACTVILNGRTVNSCLVPALKAQNAEVITIEGIGTRENLHPLQKSFIERGAIQCGFCTPGMILQAKALLDAKPRPSREEIAEALSGNLCRCTGYEQIIEAVQAAADQAENGDVTLRGNGGIFKVVGRPTPLLDAVEKALGKTQFASDMKLPNMLYCRTLRSPYPMARVLSVDTSRAKAIPGVKVVLTAEDIPGPNIQGSIKLDQPVLVPVGGLAKYIGDPIALVAAEDEEVAGEALKAIQVRYDAGEAVTSVEHAAREDETKPPNLCSHYEFSRGDVAAAFEVAGVIAERTFLTGRQEHAYLEPEAGVAYIEERIITVVAGTQAPHHVRKIAAYALGLPESRIRIKCPPTGGSFGGKQINSVQVHLALLAWKTGCPVKMVWSREESIMVHHKRHPASIRYKMAATPEGKVTGIDVDVLMDGGPYAEESPGVTNWLGMHLPGPYDIPNVRIKVRTLYTNNPISGAFRGFGAPQAVFVTESMMDCVAHELSMDPVQLRRNNFVTQASEPSVKGVVFDSPITVGLALEKALEIAGELPIPTAGHLVGRGVCCAMCLFDISAVPVRNMKGTGASVELCPDGTVIVRNGASDMGTGLSTVLGQIVSEELGVPLDRITVITGDSTLSPKTGPTIASRGTYTSGNAVRNAALALRARLLAKAAEEMSLPARNLCFREGKVVAASDPGRELSVADISAICYRDGIEARGESWFIGSHAGWGHTFVATVADVNVDLATGEVRVCRLTSVHDSGRTINPLGARGQHIGGAVQGLGYTLLENLSVRDGRILTRGLDSYLIPTSADIPLEIEVVGLEAPYPTGPYGAKGLAEHVLASVPAAICNAVFNATGYRCEEIPVIREKVLDHLRSR
ncbi:MAG: molybdopterin-dependent oxidoreductase [Firmicutes bacterium]|nr:molybdopterin-dependent oxidoreductase [Bacillota bacterium]